MSGTTGTTGTTDTTGLERAYRRILACYPRSFRRENEEEILAVLMATAGDDQRRPGIAEAADLIRGAVRMRMGLSRTPRTVLHAVRLMYLGAVAELGVLVTLLLTEGSIRAAVLHRNPQLTAAQLHPLDRLFLFESAGCCVVAVLWLCMAWANGKGNAYARIAAICLFALATAGMIGDLATGCALYAPVVMAVGGVVWLIGLAAVVLLLRPQSGPYFARQAAR
jgi:hypothetical protein